MDSYIEFQKKVTTRVPLKRKLTEQELLDMTTKFGYELPKDALDFQNEEAQNEEIVKTTLVVDGVVKVVY